VPQADVVSALKCYAAQMSLQRCLLHTYGAELLHGQRVD
jgi:hypothetical protein